MDYGTGNFINPSYATPEQVKQQREYAAQLLKGSTEPTAKHWTGALASALMGIRGQGQLDDANQLQRQLLQQGQEGLQQAAQNNPLAGALMGIAPQAAPAMSAPAAPEPSMGPRSEIPSSPKVWGDKEAVAAGLYDDPAAIPKNASPIQYQGQPRDLSAFYMNPSIPAELKKGVQEGLTPKTVQDVYGRPGYQTSMGGVKGTLVQGQFQPGVMVPTAVTPEGGISTQLPMTAPGQSAGGSLTERMQPIMDTAKDFGKQGAALKAEREQVAQDVQTAYNTIPIRQTLAAMKDDIQSHGEKMVWGPTADWLNNLKRGIAQHAPGLMSEKDISGLASADSFEKLSAQLQTMVGRQIGGTDASLLQGMRSVPGSHNSKEGALALIDMLDQVADLNAKYMIKNQYKIGQPGFDMLGEKNKFFEQNPIINPITKKPLRLDLGSKPSEPKTNSGWGIVR